MKRKQPPHVWVVEMWNDARYSPKWEPCRDGKINKSAALESAADWRQQNSGTKFRIAKYQRVKP